MARDQRDVDDPVDALEQGVLWAATEAEASGDTTELADVAAPTPPEEAAFLHGADVGADDDQLTVGLPAGTDPGVDGASGDDLVEAELVALSEGDPETVAILADELERRRGANP